jgi:mono/diheme cytochrome c family protein
LATGSLWYPINLLAAVAMPSMTHAGMPQLTAFNATGLAVAAISHVIISVFVGLVYATVLPMFPRHPAIWGGLLAPILWSVLLWATLDLINPALDRQIDWVWFVASQIAFGLTAGFVVARTEKIGTMQTWTLAARAADVGTRKRPAGRRYRTFAVVVGCGVVMAGLVGCDALPGKPKAEDRPVMPAQVVDFDRLYATNCAGCHGAHGRLGAAHPLDDPVFLALVTEKILRRVIAEGVPGTSMPGFATRAGGTLSDEQVDILTRTILSRWGQPEQMKGVQLPPYSSADAAAAGSGPGDVQRGAQAYQRYCARCHGAQGMGGPEGGSIVDPSYLALVSDQGLRTAVITGRIDLGIPDWRNNLRGQPMSPQDISDVVTWMASHRSPFPGQPFPLQREAAAR